MSERLNTLLLIGRFQPFHKGHLYTLTYGLKHADRVVIGLGSCNAERSFHNPWDPSERQQMIQNSLPIGDGNRIYFIRLYDFPGEDQKWVAQIESQMRAFGDWALLGVHKDASTFYLDLFPGRAVLCPNNPPIMDATGIRKTFFGRQDGYPLDDLPGMMPNGTREFLAEYSKTERFNLALKGAFV